MSSLLTRKQIWRRCNISKDKKKIDEYNEQKITKLRFVPRKLHRKNLSVSFDNIIMVKLIPTRKELSNIDFYYNSHKKFI